MANNNHRKCSKCGRTRSEDMSVTYHRFPKPGQSNITKASAWAKYCWPNEDWSSKEFLQSLHITNKVLCGRHFNTSQFYDNKRQKLSKFAVPDSIDVVELINNENIHQTSVVGQQHEVLKEKLENIHIPSTLVENCKTVQTLQTFEEQPSTSTGIVQSAPIQFTPSTSMESKAFVTETNLKKCSGILNTIGVSKLSQLTSREVKLYNFCRQKISKIIRLRKQIKNQKISINRIFENEDMQKLCNLNISNSFVVLLQNQLKNWPKRPKGRRYTLSQKIMALVIYKKSPACYKLLRRMFALPCQSSLNELLNRVPLNPGINKHIFISLKKMTQKQNNEDNICILSFDEMSIRKHLHYNTRQDEIQGFQDHGNHGRSNSIATKALVFMLAGIRKNWKQPIAFYFSQSINADRLTVILKEILTECFNSHINVVATVCDLSTVNRRVLKTLGATSREPFFLHCGREIVTILDPPHLLKCTRNLLMKHDIECETEFHCMDKVSKGIVKWSHIELFYHLDKNNVNFVFAPALTNYHLYPNIKQQMRVKLAAQVFSHSVAAGILAKIATNELPSEAHATATFIQKFDELFDAVNADSKDLRRGKKYSTNLTTRSPHIILFGEMKKFISTMKYLGSKSNPPSQEGWIHTINAIERLWKNLQSINIKSLSTRRLNQDPLENCFGCIRYNCGSNDNPTIQQFVAGIKTASIANLRHSSQKKNCEDDTAILSNNLSNFLTSNVPSKNSEKIAEEFNAKEIETMLSDAAKAIEQATPESQACGYVCGFIFKNLRHNNCLNCQNTFLTDTPETIHIFTSFKEYELTHRSLNYVRKEVVQCVEFMATIINNFLKTDAWRPQIKYQVLNIIDEVCDFSCVNKCVDHLDANIKHIKLSTFYICVKRFTILKNRDMEEEEKKKATERKIRILRNK